MGSQDFVADLLASARRIENEKHGQALTADEGKLLQAVYFLRKIAPDFFNDEPAPEAPEST